MVVAVLVVGLICAYSIYKCAKKALGPRPPNPPPAPPAKTNTTSASFTWNSPADLTAPSNSMAGMSYSSPKAVLTLYDWPNSNTPDRDGFPYDSWFTGTLPFQISEDLIHWRSLTVTGWVSPASIFTIVYDAGNPVGTNYSSAQTSTAGPVNYPGSTNMILIDLGPASQRFFKVE